MWVGNSTPSCAMMVKSNKCLGMLMHLVLFPMLLLTHMVIHVRPRNMLLDWTKHGEFGMHGEFAGLGPK